MTARRFFGLLHLQVAQEIVYNASCEILNYILNVDVQVGRVELSSSANDWCYRIRSKEVGFALLASGFPPLCCLPTHPLPTPISHPLQVYLYQLPEKRERGSFDALQIGALTSEEEVSHLTIKVDHLPQSRQIRRDSGGRKEEPQSFHKAWQTRDTRRCCFEERYEHNQVVGLQCFITRLCAECSNVAIQLGINRIC